MRIFRWVTSLLRGNHKIKENETIHRKDYDSSCDESKNLKNETSAYMFCQF